MKNGIKMNVLSKELMDRIKDHVNSKETLEGYGAVIGKIGRYFSLRGYDEYDPGIIMQFMDNMKNDEQKNYSKGYVRFTERVVRIMVTFAGKGVFDFSYKPSKKKRYTINEHHQEIVDDIVKENNLSDSTYHELDHLFRRLFWFIEQKGLTAEQITDELLIEFITKEIPRTVKYTIYRPVRVVKMTAAYLKVHGIAKLEKDLSILKMKGHRERIINPFTVEEMNSILNTVENSEKYKLRDRAMILMAYDAGLRGCDILNLRLNDIDWKNSTLSIIQKKTGKPVVLPLSGKTLNAVADYILKERPECNSSSVFVSERIPYGPLRKNSFKRFNKILKDSEVQKKCGRGFHSLRRAYATEMSNAGVPLETISQMLGHRNIDEDKPYLTYNRDKVSFLTYDFSLIPISAGHYMKKEEA
ncbi:MAG: tyrosine-type recombinase/integrase [Bullifex sp.]